MQHPSRPELLLERWIFGIVWILRLLFGVKVVKVAKELVEAVNRRQELILVAEVVLAELAGDIALVLEQLGDGWVLCAQPLVRPWQSDLGQSSANRRLTCDECSSPRRAALLPIPVGKEHSFLCETVDVGRFITHDPMVIGAHIPPTDVVAPDNQYVRQFSCHGSLLSLLAAASMSELKCEVDRGTVRRSLD